MRATREDSGWNTDEPTPTSAAASSRSGYVHATDRSKSPVSVKLIPATSAYGAGHRSVRNPTTGWSSDAVSINASVIRPICEKLSANDALSNG